MKFSVVVASLALAAVVSAQNVGPVDPAKLPTGWCSMYKGTCTEVTAVAQCGANSTFVTDCVSTFSMDKICTSFNVSCLCTPKAGGEQKDISAQALNDTITDMPSMCSNLLSNKNPSGPGVVSGDYKPDGKKPAATGATPSATGAPATGPKASATGSGANPTGTTSGASALQMALPTIALAVISMGMAMIPL
ncbi:hypothetical protein BGX24_005288 [Mortierella sp. AD032]|nr:hypothetical protein BGX24_005288 [Mortierella sp. AD032]